jgi:predicted nucleic acid-binding protein
MSLEWSTRTGRQRAIFCLGFAAARLRDVPSTEVLQEILYRYSALRRLDLVQRVYDLFVQICPVVFDVTLSDTDRARDLLIESEGISARDAVHVAVMLNHGVEWIASFDGGFDRVQGVRRFALS